MPSPLVTVEYSVRNTFSRISGFFRREKPVNPDKVSGALPSHEAKIVGLLNEFGYTITDDELGKALNLRQINSLVNVEEEVGHVKGLVDISGPLAKLNAVKTRLTDQIKVVDDSSPLFGRGNLDKSSAAIQAAVIEGLKLKAEIYKTIAASEAVSEKSRKHYAKNAAKLSGGQHNDKDYGTGLISYLESHPGYFRSTIVQHRELLKLALNPEAKLPLGRILALSGAVGKNITESTAVTDALFALREADRIEHYAHELDEAVKGKGLKYFTDHFYPATEAFVPNEKNSCASSPLSRKLAAARSALGSALQLTSDHDFNDHHHDISVRIDNLAQAGYGVAFLESSRIKDKSAKAEKLKGYILGKLDTQTSKVDPAALAESLDHVIAESIAEVMYKTIMKPLRTDQAKIEIEHDVYGFNPAVTKGASELLAGNWQSNPQLSRLGRIATDNAITTEHIKRHLDKIIADRQPAKTDAEIAAAKAKKAELAAKAAKPGALGEGTDEKHQAEPANRNSQDPKKALPEIAGDDGVREGKIHEVQEAEAPSTADFDTRPDDSSPEREPADAPATTVSSKKAAQPAVEKPKVAKAS